MALFAWYLAQLIVRAWGMNHEHLEKNLHGMCQHVRSISKLYLDKIMVCTIVQAYKGDVLFKSHLCVAPE